MVLLGERKFTNVVICDRKWGRMGLADVVVIRNVKNRFTNVRLM